jgi:hypothetical protein
VSVEDVVADLLKREVLSEFAGVEEYLTFDPETRPEGAAG